MATVREATFHLLRRLGMTTVFGNPGSTELPFLKDFPEDFRYVLGLQEATVLGMAEGFAQGTGQAALGNLHTGPGLGNAMGAMIMAWHDKTPLVVTAGHQDRRHRSLEPLLTLKARRPCEALRKRELRARAGRGRARRDPARLPHRDATASGPCLRLDPDGRLGRRSRAAGRPRRDPPHRPRPRRNRAVRWHPRGSAKPAVVTGAGVERSGAFHDAVTLAEKLAAPVWQDPISPLASFPRAARSSRGISPRPRSSSPHGSRATTSSSSSARPSSSTIPTCQVRLSRARHRYSTSPRIPKRWPVRRSVRASSGMWGLRSGVSRSYCQGWIANPRPPRGRHKDRRPERRCR